MARAWRTLRAPVWGSRVQAAPSLPGIVFAGDLSAGSTSWSSRRDAGAWLNVYNRNSRVRGPVSRIAQDVAAPAWILKREVGRRPDGTPNLDIVREHPLLDLWRRPNPDMTGSEFIELLTVYVEMCGVAPIWIVRDSEDVRRTPDGFGIRPKYLMPIRPQDILRAPTRSHPHWQFRIDNGERLVTRECRPQDMILYRQIDPLSPYRGGIGTAESISSEVTLDEAIRRWLLNLFRQGTRIGKVISVLGLTQDSARELEAHYEKHHVGVDNAHRDLFVGGETKVQDLGAAPSELGYDESQRLLRDTQRQAWTVPGDILGIGEDSNRAQADAALNFHQRQNVAPRLTRLESMANLFIVPLYGDPSLRLCAANPVQESADAQHRFMTDGLVRGAVTVNEWRESHNMAPLPDAQGNRLYVPLNIVQTEAEEQSRGVRGTGGPGAKQALEFVGSNGNGRRH